jgi:hypothetical protein
VLPVQPLRPAGRRPALLLVALLTACSGGSSGADTIEVGGEPVPASQLVGAAAGLCQAAGEARSDLATARATFFNRSHADIHVIARALESVDRSQAGRILTAKQRVESELLSEGPPAPTLAADLRRLFAATRSGLRRLDVPVPDCGES